MQVQENRALPAHIPFSYLNQSKPFLTVPFFRFIFAGVLHRCCVIITIWENLCAYIISYIWFIQHHLAIKKCLQILCSKSFYCPSIHPPIHRSIRIHPFSIPSHPIPPQPAIHPYIILLVFPSHASVYLILSISTSQVQNAWANYLLSIYVLSVCSYLSAPSSHLTNLLQMFLYLFSFTEFSMVLLSIKDILAPICVTSYLSVTLCVCLSVHCLSVYLSID